MSTIDEKSEELRGVNTCTGVSLNLSINESFINNGGCFQRQKQL